mmetsp:Transcript_80839/g.148946  ORF Transcript_80839/g.148946 Transcript_80839/m.148946 type:complete len:860 (+) Transcript_80839:141-2720(+)
MAQSSEAPQPCEEAPQPCAEAPQPQEQEERPADVSYEYEVEQGSAGSDLDAADDMDSGVVGDSVEGGSSYAFGAHPVPRLAESRDLLRLILVNLASKPMPTQEPEEQPTQESEEEACAAEEGTGAEEIEVEVVEDEPAQDEAEKEPQPQRPALPPMESIVWLELVKGVLSINDEATDVFADESNFVNPVMVCGKLRTGKSYLMNALSDSQAFGVSSQARSFTQGVHVCNRLVPPEWFGVPPDGPKLAFVDAEGQADKGKSYDIKLATPLLLVSKVIIMNEVCPTGPSKEDILRTLEIMMRAAEQVSERKKRAQLFGNLHLVMRDCAQEESECWSIIFDMEPQEEQESAERQKAIEERNKIRESIFEAFETMPRVWCLPKLMMTEAPKNYRDASPDYVSKINEMREAMSEQLAMPKLLDGKPLTGAMIAALMPQLQEALKSDSPILNPPSMMQAVCDLEADRIGQQVSQEAERTFRLEMTRKLPLEQPFYDGEVDAMKAELAEDLRKRIQHLPKGSAEKVFGPFEQRLQLMDERLAAINREKLADRATLEALKRARDLEDEMDAERRRTNEARAQIDALLREREEEKERAQEAFRQMREMEKLREEEQERIQELENLLSQEQSTREAELHRQMEEERLKREEAERTLAEEEERKKEDQLEQEKLMEEQRKQMEEMERQMEEERKMREEAERELGMRAEEEAKDNESAEVAEEKAKTAKEPPLIWATKANDVSAIRGLLRKQPDCLNATDKNQRCALHFAEEIDTCKALIKGKADPNAQDMGLWTPLHNAAQRHNVAVAQILLDAGGNAMLTTLHKNTALDLAYASLDMTTLLLGTLPEFYNPSSDLALPAGDDEEDEAPP